MIFSVPLRTRATDCGPDRWVDLPFVITFMEHCRWEWMKQPELGLVEAVHEGHGFYVVRQSIALLRRFGMHQDAEVRCMLTKVGRSLAEGRQDVVRRDGVTLAHCAIRGAWVSPTGRLTRIPARARDSVLDQPLEVRAGEPAEGHVNSLFSPPEPLRSGRLDLDLPDPIVQADFTYGLEVRASDIDIFDHVNAANYVRFVASALGRYGVSPSIHRAELEYVGQAKLGEALEVRVSHQGGELFAADILRDGEVLFRSVVEVEVRA